jgi:hypothetical protein
MKNMKQPCGISRNAGDLDAPLNDASPTRREIHNRNAFPVGGFRLWLGMIEQQELVENF